MLFRSQTSSYQMYFYGINTVLIFLKASTKFSTKLALLLAGPKDGLGPGRRGKAPLTRSCSSVFTPEVGVSASVSTEE